MVERWRTNGAEQAMLRAAAVRRLARLQTAGKLTNDQAELVAEVLGVSTRTVWRWLAEHTGTGRTGASRARGSR